MSFSRARKLKITTAAAIVKETPARHPATKAIDAARAPTTNARRRTRSTSAGMSLDSGMVIHTQRGYPTIRPSQLYSRALSADALHEPEHSKKRGDEPERAANIRRNHPDSDGLPQPFAKKVSRQRREQKEQPGGGTLGDELIPGGHGGIESLID